MTLISIFNYHIDYSKKWAIIIQNFNRNEIQRNKVSIKMKYLNEWHERDDIILFNWTIVISITTMDLGKYQNIELPCLFVYYFKLKGVFHNWFSPHEYISYLLRNILDQKLSFQCIVNILRKIWSKNKIISLVGIKISIDIYYLDTSDVHKIKWWFHMSRFWKHSHDLL